MLISYHNHTRWSDGRPTVPEHVAAAERLGLDELGISDHFVLAPGRKPVSWSMPLDALTEYVTEIREIAASSEMPVRLGIEADFYPDTVTELKAMLSPHPFDYVIGSVHHVDGFAIDSRAEPWEALNPAEVNGVWRLYWRRIKEMAESGDFDFAAHLDLPKKFGFRPTEDLSTDIQAALNALSVAGMAIEINTAGWSLPAQEAYPSLPILRQARARDIPLLINADAHREELLVRDFDRARELAREAGYTELVRYEQRRRIPYPLPAP